MFMDALLNWSSNLLHGFNHISWQQGLQHSGAAMFKALGNEGQPCSMRSEGRRWNAYESRGCRLRGCAFEKLGNNTIKIKVSLARD